MTAGTGIAVSSIMTFASVLYIEGRVVYCVGGPSKLGHKCVTGIQKRLIFLSHVTWSS
jgi:hypothetical protein